MKKGQAALEFLTTYGWAFLVILVMIGALAYFGVLNPKAMLPGRCTFGPEVDCLEYKIFNVDSTNSRVSFRFRNNVGSSSAFNFSAVYLSGANPGVNCSNYQQVAVGRVNEVHCNFTATQFPVGDKVKFEISGMFKKSDGMYWTPVKGEIYGEVQ